MLVKDLVNVIDIDARDVVSLELFNGAADLIAERLMRENGINHKAHELLEAARKNDKNELLQLIDNNEAVRMAAYIVIKSRVDSLSRLLSYGSINVLDGLEVERIEDREMGFAIVVKEV